MLNHRSGVIARLTVAHSPVGFTQLDALRAKVGVDATACWVGLETAHPPLIDWLWANHYPQVFVIPPHAVRRARERERQTSGSDAWLARADASGIPELQSFVTGLWRDQAAVVAALSLP